MLACVISHAILQLIRKNNQLRVTAPSQKLTATELAALSEARSLARAQALAKRNRSREIIKEVGPAVVIRGGSATKTHAPGNRGREVRQALSHRPAETLAGEQYILQTLDPFSDVNRKPVGLPDTISAPSVVERIKMTTTISAPATADGGNWDCHVTLTPFLSALENVLAQGTHNIGFYTGGVNASGLLLRNTAISAPNPNQPNSATPALSQAPSGVIIMTCATGANTWGNASSMTYPNTQVLDPIYTGPGQLALSCPHRTIGAAFEITNDTATLSNQGHCLVYSQNSCLSSEMFAESVHNEGGPTGSADATGASFVSMTSPPASITQARDIPNSIEWRAEHGAYVQARYTGAANPPENLRSVRAMFRRTPVTVVATDGSYATEVPCVFDAGGDPISGTVDVSGVGSGPNIPLVPVPYIATITPKSFAPIENSGAYLTGLSTVTTLTVSAVFYVEYFPPSDHSSIAVAAPSTTYDPLAIQSYCKALPNLPVGCPQTANPAGEWFKSVLGVVGDVAGPISSALSMIPGLGFLAPIGQTIGKGARGLSDMFASRGMRKR